MKSFDVIIIGAGAAGLMCAIEAAKRGRTVLILEQAKRAGQKILMSGGGRCNFTNLNIAPELHYISHNPHFCKSALKRYTQSDFIDLVKKHGIGFHEKKLGQLFCNEKSHAILTMLLHETTSQGVSILLQTTTHHIEKSSAGHFHLQSTQGDFSCASLVIASGGLSIPTMGSSPFGYKIAEQFGLKVWPQRPGLVPLTLNTHDKNNYASLSGVSVDAIVHYQKINFRENILFTHKGISGPAILQISSYWQCGEALHLNLLPDLDMHELLNKGCQKEVKTVLSQHIPKRVVEAILSKEFSERSCTSLNEKDKQKIATIIQNFSLFPNGTEGYRTAEVTLGGVDCNDLSSKTMEALKVPGLYFIGEVVDITGWLGGYNFQWAWSSGWAAGQVA